MAVSRYHPFYEQLQVMAATTLEGYQNTAPKSQRGHKRKDRLPCILASPCLAIQEPEYHILAAKRHVLHKSSRTARSVGRHNNKICLSAIDGLIYPLLASCIMADKVVVHLGIKLSQSKLSLMCWALGLNFLYLLCLLIRFSPSVPIR